MFVYDLDPDQMDPKHRNKKSIYCTKQFLV